jgi:hypothetical protein
MPSCRFIVAVTSGKHTLAGQQVGRRGSVEENRRIGVKHWLGLEYSLLHEWRAATSLSCSVPEYMKLSLGVRGMGCTQLSLQYDMSLMIGRTALGKKLVYKCHQLNSLVLINQVYANSGTCK